MPSIVLNKTYILDYMEKNNVRSMAELAGNIGISDSLLSRLMSGDRKPGQKTISLMLTYFNVPFERVFSYETNLSNVKNTA